MNSTCRKCFFISSFLSSLFVENIQVLAETETVFSTVSRNELTNYELPDMVITARKKSEQERIQEVPLTISVFSGKLLEDTFAVDLTNIGEMIPNVTLNDATTFANTSIFSIRGMGVFSDLVTDEPTVGVFVDGMYLGINLGSLIDLFDAERVEVLRGPQGTLFGRNVTGGAVLIRHRRPTGEFHIRGKTTVGSYDWVEQNLVLEAPITDTLAGKLGMVYREEGGYFDNVSISGDRIGENDTWLLRPMLTWRPTSDLELTLISQFSRFEGDGAIVRLVEDKFFGTPPSRDPQDLMNDLQSEAQDSIEQAVLDLNWKIGPGELTSITGWRQVDTEADIDVDGTGLSIFHVFDFEIEQDQFSEELRYAAIIDDRAELTTGITFFTQDIVNKARSESFFGTIKGASGGELEHTAMGVFSQGDFYVSDSWTLTLGARYTWEEKKIRAVRGGGPCETDFDDCPFDFEEEEDWDFVSGHAGISWYPTEEMLVYSHWTRSFRSGGFSLRTSLPALPGPYDEEKVNAFEIGLKADWLDGRLRTNLAGFYNRYTDLQRTLVTASLTEEKLNAANANMAGFDVELALLPTDHFELNTSVGYVDASFDTYQGLDVDGDGAPDPELARNLKLLGVPEWTAFVGGKYSIPLRGRYQGELELRASASFTDKQALTEINSLFQDRYTLVNASIRYRFSKDKFGVSIFGRNLLDEDYANIGLSTALFDVLWAVQPGTTYGIELTYSF